MKTIYGNTQGLKTHHNRYLEKLYRRKIPPDFLVTPEIVREIVQISIEINRQVALLIDRKGQIQFVIVGDYQKIVLPSLEEYRTGLFRLKGLRCVHTHLSNTPLTQEDLTDLALLRLDIMASIAIDEKRLPAQIHFAYLIPSKPGQSPYLIQSPIKNLKNLQMDCFNVILAIEDEFSQSVKSYDTNDNRERALLISVTNASKHEAEEAMDELVELAESGHVHVLDRIIQYRPKVDSRFLMGRGKLNEMSIHAMQTGATLLIFNQELNPSQIRSITDSLELRVIDRTQLILDIFAQRAQTLEGKLQVELAQLKYVLPRLVTKNTAMSRLTGGIGGRGPGETKLEINRRRVHERIRRIETSLQSVQKRRKQQRAKRSKRYIPIISIIGYTNAGKSTLLNTLTNSQVVAEKRLFATLDPYSRRMRFPKDIEVIITDTVGFIKDLPKDLLVAFQATLEELEQADLFLHVIDSSNPRCENQIHSVEMILKDLGLHDRPMIYVLNKMDQTNSQYLTYLLQTWGPVCISANDQKTLRPLIQQMEQYVQKLL